MAKYRLSRLAEADLSDIATYTLRTWGRDQAIRYVDDLEACCRKLADNPDLGRACDHVRPGLRPHGARTRTAHIVDTKHLYSDISRGFLPDSSYSSCSWLVCGPPSNVIGALVPSFPRRCSVVPAAYAGGGCEIPRCPLLQPGRTERATNRAESTPVRTEWAWTGDPSPAITITSCFLTQNRL